MSWGIRITLLYLGFMVLILTLVFTCINNKSELESKDYYARELKYQAQLDATNNANALVEQIEYRVMDRAVLIHIPDELLSDSIQGNIHFLRPSDASKDKTIPLKPGTDGIQVIDPGFIKGAYKMQIGFKSKGKSYFKESIVTFP
jgi:hypothetical protein